MAVSYSSFRVIFLLFSLFATLNMAQTSSSAMATNFSCSADSSPSCETYVAYFAQPPNLRDLGNISDLFGVSRASVAKARNRYFVNISYQIQKGDTYHSLSTVTFVNLTNPSVLEDLNPGIDPNFLLSGINDIVVPLFCKCPSNTYLKNGIQHLITYVWQPNNEVSNVSSKFNASMDDIVRENQYQSFRSAVDLPVLIPVSKLPVLPREKSPHKSSRSKQQWILIGVESLGGRRSGISPWLGLQATLDAQGRCFCIRGRPNGAALREERVANKKNGEVVMLWKELGKILEEEEKREERLKKWMDPNLQSFYPIDGALGLVALAKACTQGKSSARPKMAEIVFSLSVLTQSSAKALKLRSTNSGGDPYSIVQVITPVSAR
ncbi:hypothetical protein L484_009158 [Morus notabilis]|uniref:Uncharacterized protein n=1 Tax=Morus notabilis TaxID=981085 RepID=W9R9M4_9ROSA|nr:hypothetical protein L484_009158 [Morus notabilis]